MGSVMSIGTEDRLAGIDELFSLDAYCWALATLYYGGGVFNTGRSATSEKPYYSRLHSAERLFNQLHSQRV